MCPKSSPPQLSKVIDPEYIGSICLSKYTLIGPRLPMVPELKVVDVFINPVK